MIKFSVKCDTPLVPLAYKFTKAEIAGRCEQYNEFSYLRTLLMEVNRTYTLKLESMQEVDKLYRHWISVVDELRVIETDNFMKDYVETALPLQQDLFTYVNIILLDLPPDCPKTLPMVCSAENSCTGRCRIR